ncbi:ribonuclease P protein component [Candidatus Blochmanniella camponoti]|uniref:Ribonuclease P protein component n=1 Tax=Candidatus Blochmanniella camponoti TaxID=108080 RepID=A0AAE9L553_9ENTR|nr:ribonuclease P protein component [Candidatus Blochmannia herculeanus]URJ24463.1 ribonuclease P protein component [Candidatus Blochmannia herculeanus]URJ26929.1 ribonuclease P protein component [Candidatus Blochmannia herculeanus]URJ27818.1 ribonuclease P protein component [Candidatus Blochmannia herculeanus]
MNRKFLPKRARLLNLNEFIFVFQKPERVKTTGITLFSRSNRLGYPRIGLAISKKYVKYAHERNRIKRHIRETFRTYQHNLLAKDFVLTIRSKEIIHCKNKTLIQELEKLWYHHLC